MKLCISDFGFFSKGVEDDYIPLEGEALFDGWPSEQVLLETFPGRPAKIAQMEKDRLSGLAREKRDGLLRNIYDAGTQMIRREMETIPLDPAYESKLINKRAELHAYARLLQAVPDQAGFPETITWPAIPAEELS